MNGLFITIEGPDGAGKTSVLNELYPRLQLTAKRSIVKTREPGGIPIAEKIRHVILDPSNDRMDDRTEALLYAAARRQHLIEKVWPALDEDKINLAMSLAPLAAVAIYGKGGFNPVVFIGWMAAFIGVGSVCLIRYPKREKVPRPHFSLDRFILVKALPAALAYILVAIPYGMITSFVVLYGKEIEVANPGYFFIYMAVGVGTSRLVSGRLVDHGKIHWVSVCSAVCLLVTFTVFATVRQSWVFFVCALMIGIGYGVGVPAFQCLFVNVAPHNMRGTATSTYLTSFDLGVGIGMLSAGFIASCAGLAVAYGVGAGCCLASLGVYLRWVRPSYEKHKLLV